MDFVDLWRTRIIFKQFGKAHYHYIDYQVVMIL